MLNRLMGKKKSLFHSALNKKRGIKAQHTVTKNKTARCGPNNREKDEGGQAGEGPETSHHWITKGEYERTALQFESSPQPTGGKLPRR